MRFSSSLPLITIGLLATATACSSGSDEPASPATIEEAESVGEPASEPEPDPEPTTTAPTPTTEPTPAEIITDVTASDGVVTVDLPDTWTVDVDKPDWTLRSSPDDEATELVAQDLEEIAGFVSPDGETDVRVFRTVRPTGLPGTDAIAESLSDLYGADGDVESLSGTGAHIFTANTSGRSIETLVVRLGDEVLLIQTRTEQGDSSGRDVAFDVADSIRLDPTAFPTL